MKYGLYINERIYLKGSTSKILAIGNYIHFKKTDFGNSVCRVLSGVLSSSLCHMKEGGLWEHSDFTRIYLMVWRHTSTESYFNHGKFQTCREVQKIMHRETHPPIPQVLASINIFTMFVSGLYFFNKINY